MEFLICFILVILTIFEAKKKCDILIVSVTHDDFINKGPGRPAFNHNIRMQSVVIRKC